MSRRVLVALVLLAAACTRSGTGVVLTIEGPGLSIDHLDIVASLPSGDVDRSVDSAAVQLPTMVVAELPDEAARVSFTVTGRLGGTIVGQGVSDPVEVTPHQIASARVTLGGGGGDGGGGSDGGGASWTLQHGGPPLGMGTITGLWGSSGGDVYATSSVGGGFNLFRSTNQSGTWVGQAAGGGAPPADLDGVWGSSFNDVYLVGAVGLILHGSGTSWTAQSAPISSSTHLHGVFGLAANDVYAVGSGNTVLHSVTGGWVVQTPAGTTELRAVWGMPGSIFVVGDSGTILHSTGNGTWQAQTSGTTAHLRSVFSRGNGIWVVGDGGVVLSSSGNGTWAPASSGIPQAISLGAVTVAPTGDVFAAGTGFSIFRWSGNAWIAEATGLVSSDPPADRLQALFAPSGFEVFAGGAGQTLLHRP